MNKISVQIYHPKITSLLWEFSNEFLVPQQNFYKMGGNEQDT